MRTALKIVAAGTLLVLAACSKPAAPAAPKPEPVGTSVVLSEDPVQTQYTVLLRRDFPGITDAEIRRAMDLGHMVCGELDAGLTIRELNVQLVRAHAEPRWAAAVVGYGVGAFCPQYLPLLGK